MDIELIVTGVRSGRGAAPIILTAIVLLPIALALAASTQRRGRGPTWSELLAPLGRWTWPAWGAARHGFGWPVRRSIDKLYGLLVTESGDVILVRHDRHDQRPYHTLPGGTIQSDDECPEDVLGRWLGGAAGAVEGWELVHVEQRARHQELLFSGRLTSQRLDTARAATRHHLEAVHMTPAGLAHLDLHPHGVSEVVRRLAADRPRLA
jgi:hypothetical protein